jgi:hypothetical protein
MRHASRFSSETPDPDGIRNPQIGWAWEKKRRDSLERSYQRYETAKALLAEWEAMPATEEAIAEIKRLRKKLAAYSCQLRYKGASFTG